MSRVFDPSPILDLLPSFWKEYYADRSVLERYWESAVRLMDDEWSQTAQIDASGSAVTCPSFIYHTYLYLHLEDWQSYGLPHSHFRKNWRATAAQTVFYVGAWVDPKTIQVFLDGKEVDPSTDPFQLTLLQDSTQPGINPAGARLIFTNPIALNSSVMLFADKEIVYAEIEVPPGGLTSYSFSQSVDPDSVKVTLKKINLTRFFTLSTTSFSWSVYTSLTGITDTRKFYKGETFEIIDGAVKQSVTLTADSTSVSFSVPVNPLTAKVYKVLGFDITPGNLRVEGKKLISKNQPFPIAVLVRIADLLGSEGKTVLSSATAIEYSREIDPERFTAFMYSGEISSGYSADSSSVTFVRSFMEGMVILIEASMALDNDHAENRQVITVPTSTFSVPASRPFALTPLLAERAGYPVQFFVDGVLQHPDTYTFLSTTTIQSLGAVPAGTVIDFYYVDLEDPVQHFHVREEFTPTVATSAFALADFVESRFSRYVSVGGAVVSDPAQRYFIPDGTHLNFATSISAGTRVVVRGARERNRFYHSIDPDIVRAAYLQNGIDPKSTAIPAGYTIQLAWDSGFAIPLRGLLESDEKIEHAWLVDAYVDERTAYNNFGSLIGIDRPTSDEYVRILRALFGGSYQGSTPYVLENYACILLGSEYLSHVAKVDSIIGDVVTAGGESLTADLNVPLRVSANVEYPQYHAISGYVTVMDEWDAFRELPLMVSSFSDDYTFARTLDVNEPSVLDGGPCLYYRSLTKLIDSAVNFVEEEVWPGDLILMYAVAAPTTKVYGRIIKVEENSLIVNVDLSPAEIGYGQGQYGQFFYGGGYEEVPIDRYRIWNRKTDTMDVWKHLDEASEEDLPYLADVLHSILSPFVFLVEFRWAGIADATALRDVIGFLDRAKAVDTKYIAYTRVEEGDLKDLVSGVVADLDPAITELPNYLFVSSDDDLHGFVGINGTIAPINVGSFLGP